MTDTLVITRHGADTVLAVSPWAATLKPDDFEPSSLAAAKLIVGEAIGRGTVIFRKTTATTHEHASRIHSGSSQVWVLRHYLRGGLMALINRDYYVGCDIRKTRAYRELSMLVQLEALRLPAPRPIGARVRMGFGWYQADLLTEKIPDTTALADLGEHDFNADLGVRVGQVIRQFHRRGICHADLNARNILLDTQQVYWIDFDRATKRAPGAWQQANLARLYRSLNKLGKTKLSGFNAFWQTLLLAYRQ